MEPHINISPKLTTFFHRTAANFKAYYADILISESAAPEKKQFPVYSGSHKFFFYILMMQLSTIFLLVFALKD